MRSWLLFYTYNFLLFLLSPILLIYAIARGIRGKEACWAERLGFVRVPGLQGRPRIWIHAVSAGEVAAAVPVIRELMSRNSDAAVFVSTITRAGREMAVKLCSETALVFYFPIDTPWSARRALAAVRPDVVVLLEAEIWPNFLFQASRHRIPVIVVNGRISDKGFRHAKLAGPFLRWGLRSVAFFGMQTQLDAQRITAMGADPDRVCVLGNTKFDQETTSLPPDEVRCLRASLQIAERELVLVAGSTRPGEEEVLLEAYARLLNTFPNLRMILAPRHLERTQEVEALIRRYGFTPVRRTALLPNGLPQRAVTVLDTMGELGRVYAVASVTFVGGTLVPIGGHNILQPIAQGKPVFFGPYTHGIRDVAASAIAAGVGFRVTGAEDLAMKAADLLNNPSALDELRYKCAALMDANRGASARYAERIAAILNTQTASTGTDEQVLWTRSADSHPKRP
ncbi:MAG: 3-deoxy-D-manno-octulosonic acid transferase [Armatimonadota bacterium]